METISDFDAPKGQPVQSGAWSQVTSCDWGWSAAGAQVSAVLRNYRSLTVPLLTSAELVILRVG